MAPSNLFSPVDPTFHFIVNTLMSPNFVAVDTAAKSVAFGLPTVEDLAAFIMDPVWAIGATCFIVAMAGVWSARGKLTKGESLAANWYLWNFVVIHVMMDGLWGGMGWGGKMNDYYRVLDKRYSPELVDQHDLMGPTEGDRAAVFILNGVELFIHSFFALFAFWAVVHKSKYRTTMECICLTLQILGAIMFVGPDLLYGKCPNMQPFGVDTCFPPVTPFYLFFVYFAVGINFIWIIVPCIRLAYVVVEDVAEKAALKKQLDTLMGTQPKKIQQKNQ